MLKKQTSTESDDDDDDDDEQTNEGSESLPVSHKEDTARRAKMDPVNNTTLQDLPFEIVEYILVKAVAMEVKGLKLAKSAWKEKADLVISRLRNVCSQWDVIMTTNFFRNELHRALDGSAQEAIRLEILEQSSIQSAVFQVTTVKDEIFMLCKQHGQCSILVYNRSNTADVKDVIALPGIHPVDIAGCSVSNCVYALTTESLYLSVLRITIDDEHQSSVSPWISDLRLTTSTMSVSSSGCVTILSRDLLSRDLLSQKLLLSEEAMPNPALVAIYSADGTLRNEIILSPDVCSVRNVFNVIQKPNGNLVLVSTNERLKRLITEIDLSGRILRQYQSGLCGHFGVCLADAGGRILIGDWRSKMELLDCELNPLDITGQQLCEGQFVFPSELHYDSERNEIMCICYPVSARTKVLTIICFTHT